MDVAKKEIVAETNAQPSICPEDWDAQTPLGFWHPNASPNLGQTTRLFNNLQKREHCRIVDFADPADHGVKLKESEKKDKYLELARELKKKTMEHESDGVTNCNCYSLYSHQMIGTRTSWLGNKKMNRDNSNYSIIDFAENNEKSPGNLRRLVVT